MSGVFFFLCFSFFFFQAEDGIRDLVRSRGLGDVYKRQPRILPSRELDGEQSDRPLFQLHGTYILAQLRNGYMVVDQHRAHERVLFERNLKLLESGAGLTQTELFPRHVELNAADLAMVEEVLPDLRKMGFDLELFGGRTVQVNGMPAEAADEDPTRLLENLLEQLKQQKGGCLLYTSDAADERSSVDLGGRRIIKKKK